MLGGNTPLAGCKLEGASVELTVVVARYDCAGKSVTVKLLDPAGGAPGLQTEQFRVVTEGDAPPGFTAALAESIRSREHEFARVAPARKPGPVEARWWSTDVPSVAWILLGIWLVSRAPVYALRKRGDAIIALGLAAIALGLRVLVPRGPLDFAEASRVAPAWNLEGGDIEVIFSSIPALLVGLRRAELPMVRVFEFVGPALAAAGVGATYVLARAMKLAPRAAVLAAVLVLVAPSHLRYSVTLLALGGSTLWIMAFAVGSSENLGSVDRVVGYATLVTLGVYSRPEYRLLLVPAAALTFAPGWTARTRLAVLAILAFSLGPYYRFLAPSERSEFQSVWISHFIWMASAPILGELWLLGAGIFAIARGTMPRVFRVTLGLAVGLPLLGYLFLATETNPFWGESRYLVGLIPFFAVAAASLTQRLPLWKGRDPKLALIALAVLCGVLGAHAVMRPIDFQTEYAYLLESSARIAKDKREMVLLRDESRPGIPFDATPSMAISLAVSQAVRHRGSECPERGNPGAPSVILDRTLLSGCLDDLSPDESALYLGLFRPQERIAELEALYQIIPIEERVFQAAPTVPFINTQCPVGSSIQGDRLPDCEFRLGWYRLVRKPRGPAP